MNAIMSSYIDEMQKRRKELKLSYDKLVEMTGIPKATITSTLLKYLKRSPSADVINKLSIALQMPAPAELQQGVGEITLTPDIEELIMLYNEIGTKLGKEAQKGFVNYARFLVDGKN